MANVGDLRMRGKILIASAVSAAALVLAACGGGASSEQRTKLVELCKKNEPKPESCECQVDVMLKEGDPKVVAFMVAMADLEEKVKADPASAAKMMEDAIKAAGFADQEEFGKTMAEMQTKLEPKIEACKK
jgi:galactitol-specific phosphotransferase system IIB component